MDLQGLLSQSLGGELLFTMLVSMLPVVELRGGIPLGMGAGLPLPLAVIASVIGNMLPIPFLILFTRRVFAWLRRHLPVLERFISKLERKADAKKELVLQYQFWGLLILVAIPLPGTGAWTGALVAALMDLRLKSALPAIFTGVLVAAGIVSCITMGLISI
ncbi:MAG: small multi-drug export protein [Bacillota bacterium]|nr:small multi-drug export protein [Bacillota bacterium]